MSDEPFDTRFTLPGTDDPPEVEIGVILLGLDADRLLAGLGVAGPDDDATTVTLRVDQLRHDVPGDTTLADAVAAGAARWRAARDTLAAADPGAIRTAALRQLWTGANDTVAAAARVDPTLGAFGPAQRAYLAACWLRRAEVDGALAHDDHSGPAR
jgi:hypothetical protein